MTRMEGTTVALVPSELEGSLLCSPPCLAGPPHLRQGVCSFRKEAWLQTSFLWETPEFPRMTDRLSSGQSHLLAQAVHVCVK